MSAQIINLKVVSDQQLIKREAIEGAVKERCRSLGLSSDYTRACVEFGEYKYRKEHKSPAAAIAAATNVANNLAMKLRGELPPAA